MHGWHAQRDGETDLIVHATRAGFGHAVLSPILIGIFRNLRVAASLWEHGNEWFPLHGEPNVSSFEHRYGVSGKRFEYNGARSDEVLRLRKAVRGTHAGYSDLFVPVVARGQVVATVVTGPFALGRPTSADVLERWRWLTGRQGHLGDPEFGSYMAATFDALVLEREEYDAFERILGCLVRLMSGEGSAEAIINESEPLRARLDEVRLPERMREAVEEMVDPHQAGGWHTAEAAADLVRLGLPRMPDTVLVGLTGGEKDVDPIDEALCQNAFQRACVEVAGAEGDTVVGRVGNHGVVFLCAGGRAAERRRKKLRALASRAATLARREFGLRVHWGMGPVREAVPLVDSYHAALAAAESALIQGSSLIETGAAESGRAKVSLVRLRLELGRAVEERPDQLGARFDRYLEAVIAQCGHATDATRRHLDAGLEWMGGLLVRSGTLEEKSFGALCDALERTADEVRTLDELASAYRRAVRDLSETVRRPVAARQERSLRTALEYIAQHYAEPLSLKDLARVAGVAPDHFRRLFRDKERATLTRYIQRLRIERAKQLLTNTGLSTQRVAEMSGFNSAQYFCRAFRAATRTTPSAYRSIPEHFPAARRKVQKKDR